MKKIVLSLTIMLSVLVGQLTQAQVIPGIKIADNFIPLDSIKNNYNWQDRNFDEKDDYDGMRYLLSVARKFHIEIIVVFKMNDTTYVPLDSLFQNTSYFPIFYNQEHAKLYSRPLYFDREGMYKLAKMLEQSVKTNSMITWGTVREWRDLGFLWGQNVIQEKKILYKPPYSIETETTKEPEIYFTGLISLVLLFISLNTILFVLLQPRKPKRELERLKIEMGEQKKKIESYEEVLSGWPK